MYQTAGHGEDCTINQLATVRRSREWDPLGGVAGRNHEAVIAYTQLVLLDQYLSVRAYLQSHPGSSS